MDKATIEGRIKHIEYLRENTTLDDVDMSYFSGQLFVLKQWLKEIESVVGYTNG